MIFHDENRFLDFQENALKRICKYYRRSFQNISPSTTMPSVIYDTDVIQLKTSGSMSSSRNYKYSLMQYMIIETHQLWRIEQAHEMDYPGIVLSIKYSPTYNINQNYEECFLSELNESSFELGKDNRVTLLNYRRNTGDKSFCNTMMAGRDINPKFVEGSPSQLEFMYLRSGGKIQFDCPFISTRETLRPHVRALGMKMFPLVIDKMRCWDGGMGFFECKHGRRHVYDELAYIEQTNNRLLASTDFYNYATPFLRYVNSDVGDLDIGICNCGVYGKYLKSFEGKVSEVIKVGNYLIPGSLIVEDINSLLLFGGCSSNIFSKSLLKKYGHVLEGTDIIYRVKQTADGRIHFYYYAKEPLNDTQLSVLKDALHFIFYRHVDGLDIAQKEKEFYVHPTEITVQEDRDLMCHTKGVRTKSLCIESELICTK